MPPSDAPPPYEPTLGQPDRPEPSRETAVGPADPAPHRPTMPAAAPRALPGFESLGELGRGGMGVVFKARQLRLNRVVALKMVLHGMVLHGEYATPEELARFLQEAETVARLSHPHIVQVYETGHSGGVPYFALEFVPGGSLADRLRAGPLPPAETARLARAMAYAHSRGVVHRDLKPANALLAVESAESKDERKDARVLSQRSTPNFQPPRSPTSASPSWPAAG